MEEESNAELELLDTLVKLNTGIISVFAYKMPKHTEQYLRYSSHQTNCKEGVVSSLFIREYSIITNKEDLKVLLKD